MITEKSAAKRLQELADQAGKIEEVMRDVRAIFHAINQGELASAAPPDPQDYDNFSAASQLLDIATRLIDHYEALPGTDLSVALSVMATDAAKECRK